MPSLRRHEKAPSAPQYCTLNPLSDEPRRLCRHESVSTHGKKPCRDDSPCRYIRSRPDISTPSASHNHQTTSGTAPSGIPLSAQLCQALFSCLQMSQTYKMHPDIHKPPAPSSFFHSRNFQACGTPQTAPPSSQDLYSCTRQIRTLARKRQSHSSFRTDNRCPATAGQKDL